MQFARIMLLHHPMTAYVPWAMLCELALQLVGTAMFYELLDWISMNQLMF